MYPLLFLMILGAVVGYYETATQRKLPPVVAIVSAHETAQNMIIYFNKVATYVNTKPLGYTEPSTGNTVPDNVLGLPAWYARNPLWTNKVIGGVVTVYATEPPPAGDIVVALVKESGSISGVGVTSATTNTILNPKFGDTGATYPAGIPVGVPIVQFRVR